MEEEFVAAKSENRPVMIKDRIIEGSALEYLNNNLSDGPGIGLSGCEIRGDLNFGKHSRPVTMRKRSSRQLTTYLMRGFSGLASCFLTFFFLSLSFVKGVRPEVTI